MSEIIETTGREVSVISPVELNNVVVMPSHKEMQEEIARLREQLAKQQSNKYTEKAAKSLLPWGNTLKKIPAEIEKIEDIMGVAGLNYDVIKKPSYIIDGNDANGNPILRETKGFSIQRSDTGAVLSNVGPEYTPLKNSERFGFLQQYITEKKIIVEYAGDLRSGEKSVIIARLNTIKPIDEIRVGDTVGRYMVFSDTYDGLQSVRAGVMGFRLRCLNGAMSQDNVFSVRVRHHANVATKVAAIADSLDLANDELDKLFERYQFLASRSFQKDNQLESYVKTVLSLEEKPDEKTGQLILPTRSKNTMDNIISRIHAGRGNGQGSWFDAYNGLTEYFSHERGRGEDTRLNSLLFGQSNREAKTALEVALQMAS